MTENVLAEGLGWGAQKGFSCAHRPVASLEGLEGCVCRLPEGSLGFRLPCPHPPTPNCAS